MTYASDVLADSPLDFYQMESNTTGTDSGSGARTATLSNISSTSGNVGNGWGFNGTSSVATMATFPSLTTNFSIEVWFKSNGNAGWTNDYPTFIRRDGTDVILVRGRNSSFAAGQSPGRAELYISSGVSITTTARFDDGLWHHAVVTVAGNAVKFYVDNALIGSATASKSTHNFGSGAGYIGGGNTAGGAPGELMQGTLDNAAFYNTALSATRVGVHYTSGQPVNVTYTANAMSATATMPGGVSVKNNTYTASAMTASANSPTAKVTLSAGLKPTDDYFFQYSNGAINDSTTLLTDANNAAVMKFDTPFPVNVLSASLSVKVGQVDVGDMFFYPILAPITGRPVSKAGFTLGTPISFQPNGTGNALDVKELFNQGRIYGLYGDFDKVDPNYPGSPFVTFSSMSSTSGNGTTQSPYVYNGPTLTVAWNNDTVANSVSATPMTATATMPNAAVDLSTDLTVTATAMTASATWVNPQVIVDKDMTFVAEAMSASVEFPGGLFSLANTVAAEPFLASATMPSTSIATTIGVLYKAEVMKATGRFVTPSAVNDNPIENDGAADRYFQRVTALKPSKWVRMTDVGRILTDKVSGQPLADIGGLVQTGRHDGPDSRASLVFNGNGSIVQRETTSTNADEYITYNSDSLRDGNLPHSFEFSFRTDRANEFILGGADGEIDVKTGVASPGATFSEVVLVDGKIGINQYRTYTPTGTRDVAMSSDIIARGFRNVADNEWHHVVIRNYQSNLQLGETGFEVWIDGTLEYRRLTRGIITFAWPDHIGYRPASPQGARRLTAIPESQIFQGDFSEMVYYAFQLGKDDIERNHYAFRSWIPFEAPAMEATATMPNANGKGNQKKALYLYWTGQDEVFGGMLGDYPAGQGSVTDARYYTNFDPQTGLQSAAYNTSSLYVNTEPDAETSSDFFGFKVFTKSITRDKTNGVTSYRDLVTDEQSLMDLDRHVNLEDYDVIMFKDWPDESYERDYYERNYPGQIERVLNQLRKANKDGIALYVTNPRLAIDLGVIATAEWVEPLTEHKFNAGQGAQRAEGMYDYGSAVKFPWNITSSDGLTGNAYATGIGVEQNNDPNYLAQKAFFYYDNNKNNKFRVVSKIPGLTDLPSYMIQDAVFHVDADTYGWEGAAYKYLHRENGLEIGDEYIFNGAFMVDPRFSSTSETRYMRGNGTWATPMAAVKAGTVVTTFGSTQYVNQSQTSNPYQNYATTIVLESGTPLNGSVTGGRIFVNFTETPGAGLNVPVQVIPGGVDSLDNTLGLNPDDLDIVGDLATFSSTGTPEQATYVADALARCTFPFQKLQSRIKQRYGRQSIPVLWADINPGQDGQRWPGKFDPITGVITIDGDFIISEAARFGQNPADAVMAILIHEFAHVVDSLYLQPYQRVNIWNLFHSEANFLAPLPYSDWQLPQNYPLDISTINIKGGEGWTNKDIRFFFVERIGEAFAQLFVQAYSDVPLNVNAFGPHPALETMGPLLRKAIEVGQGAYLFGNSAVQSEWPPGYNPETPAQKEWEYSWTRTSLSFSVAALKTRTVSVTLPDGSSQQIVQGSTEGTRDNTPLAMVRSGQLFPVVNKPRLEMTARGIYWLADAPKPATGDAVVRATPMTANAAAPSATATAQRGTVVIAQAMTATAMSPESAQAKTGNALYLASPMTADAKMSSGNERTIKAEPMTATATMPDSVYKLTGEKVTFRLPRPAKITLRIKEAV